MSQDDAEDAPSVVSTDSEIKELMGLFDAPAFARRGQDVEYAVRSLHTRCRLQREELLEMVRLRLRQWSKVAVGTDDWSETWSAPIDWLWELTHSVEPDWALQPASPRQRKNVARDLITSVERFNQRWRRFLETLNLEPTNQTIDQYNQYYVFEKECVVGSPRLAARHFTPVPRLTSDGLLREYPTLPVPELIQRP
jgi:hypothetical protein